MEQTNSNGEPLFSSFNQLDECHVGTLNPKDLNFLTNIRSTVISTYDPKATNHVLVPPDQVFHSLDNDPTEESYFHHLANFLNIFTSVTRYAPPPQIPLLLITLAYPIMMLPVTMKVY